MKIDSNNPIKARALIGSRINFSIEIPQSIRCKIFLFLFLRKKNKKTGYVPFPSIEIVLFYPTISGIIYQSVGSSYDHVYTIHAHGMLIDFIHHVDLTPQEIHVANLNSKVGRI